MGDRQEGHEQAGLTLLQQDNRAKRHCKMIMGAPVARILAGLAQSLGRVKQPFQTAKAAAKVNIGSPLVVPS